MWRDNGRGGRLVFDAPVIVQCYTSLEAIDERADDLRSFLVRMGAEASQAAVGFVIDRTDLEIKFPDERR